jgi:hypothetical protein
MTDYRNNASQRERAEALRNDTLHSRQQAMSDLENSGRHAKPYDGNWDGPHRYPPLPADAWPNQAAIVPPEESFGVDLNAVEAMGEPHEQPSLGGATIEASGSLDVAAQSRLAPPSQSATPNDPSLSQSDGGQGDPAARIPQSGSPNKPKPRRGF